MKYTFRYEVPKDANRYVTVEADSVYYAMKKAEEKLNSMHGVNNAHCLLELINEDGTGSLLIDHQSISDFDLTMVSIVEEPDVISTELMSDLEHWSNRMNHALRVPDCEMIEFNDENDEYTRFNPETD